MGGGCSPAAMTSRSRCPVISHSRGRCACPAIRSTLLAGFPHFDRDLTLTASDRVVAHHVDVVDVVPEQAVEETDGLGQLEPLVDRDPVFIRDPASESTLVTIDFLRKAVLLRFFDGHVPAL